MQIKFSILIFFKHFSIFGPSESSPTSLSSLQFEGLCSSSTTGGRFLYQSLICLYYREVQSKSRIRSKRRERERVGNSTWEELQMMMVAAWHDMVQRSDPSAFEGLRKLLI